MCIFIYNGTKNKSVSPSMKDILDEMEKSHTYGGIFPETWKLMNIMMALPVETASVERSFSQIKADQKRACVALHQI